jgi:hypothetical protein
MYINQKDAQLSVIRLYFPLDALHVSGCISPSSGVIFYELYITFGIRQYIWLLCGYRKDSSYNIKMINAQQAKRIHKYKNIKEKLYECNTAIWYNKTCRLRNLVLPIIIQQLDVPAYTKCDVPGT